MLSMRYDSLIFYGMKIFKLLLPIKRIENFFSFKVSLSWAYKRDSMEISKVDLL